MIELDILIEEPIYLDLGIADEVYFRPMPIIVKGEKGDSGAIDPNGIINGGIIF